MTNFADPENPHYFYPEVFEGLTFIKIEGMQKDSAEIQFTTTDGQNFKMFHSQRCCELVLLNDMTGDVADLLNTPILIAEKRISGKRVKGCLATYVTQPQVDNIYLWSYYTFRTIKGTVTLRWYGESNGEYAVAVSIGKMRAV